MKLEEFFEKAVANKMYRDIFVHELILKRGKPKYVKSVIYNPIQDYIDDKEVIGWLSTN